MFYGPNGIGKTTLAKTIAGVLRPLAGRVEGASDVFYVPETNELPTTLRPRQWLGALADIYGAKADQGVLREFRVPDVRMGLMSQGQRRRVLYAAAVALARRVTVFDDPLAFVDEEGAALFKLAASRLREAGSAVATMARPEQLARLEADMYVDLERHRV